MIRPIRNDARYTIALEWCGYEKPHHVLRFCGEFVAQSISAASMIVRAAGHKAIADGAVAIEAKDKES